MQDNVKKYKAVLEECLVECKKMLDFEAEKRKALLESDINNLRILDILPYNGDGRGTSYNGTYILDRLEISQKDVRFPPQKGIP